MRTSRVVCIILMLAGVAGSCLGEEPSAKVLKKCPFGHRTLKDVPIVYGLPDVNGPDAKQIKKDLAEYKYTFGGCVFGPDSPKQAVACTTCGFTYSITTTKKPEEGSWTLSVNETNKLFRPLSNVWSDYPFLETNPRSKKTITQIFSREMKLEGEIIDCTAEDSLEMAAEKLSPWFTRHRLIHNDSEEYRSGTSKNWVRKDPSLEVTIQEEDRGITNIRAVLMP
jgi:hypothetical protein